jgi:hypothetical protein
MPFSRRRPDGPSYCRHCSSSAVSAASTTGAFHSWPPSRGSALAPGFLSGAGPSGRSFASSEQARDRLAAISFGSPTRRSQARKRMPGDGEDLPELRIRQQCSGRTHEPIGCLPSRAPFARPVSSRTPSLLNPAGRMSACAASERAQGASASLQMKAISHRGRTLFRCRVTASRRCRSCEGQRPQNAAFGRQTHGVESWPDRQLTKY